MLAWRPRFHQIIDMTQFGFGSDVLVHRRRSVAWCNRVDIDPKWSKLDRQCLHQTNESGLSCTIGSECSDPDDSGNRGDCDNFSRSLRLHNWNNRVDWCKCAHEIDGDHVFGLPLGALSNRGRVEYTGRCHENVDAAKCIIDLSDQPLRRAPQRYVSDEGFDATSDVASVGSRRQCLGSIRACNASHTRSLLRKERNDRLPDPG